MFTFRQPQRPTVGSVVTLLHSLIFDRTEQFIVSEVDAEQALVCSQSHKLEVRVSVLNCKIQR